MLLLNRCADIFEFDLRGSSCLAAEGRGTYAVVRLTALRHYLNYSITFCSQLNRVLATESISDSFLSFYFDTFFCAFSVELCGAVMTLGCVVGWLWSRV